MKNPFKSFISWMLLSSFCIAQTAAPAPDTAVVKQKSDKIDTSKLKFPRKPMLWKIEGKDLKKPSYLFGSIHLGDENVVKLHPRVEDAYVKSDTFATEVSMALEDQLAAMKMIVRDDKKTLKQVIGAKLHADLKSEMAEFTPLITVDQISNYKTWGAVITFSMLEEFGKHHAPLDFVLWQRALADEKDLWALETVNEQLGGFDKLTENEQIILLKDTITTYRLFRKQGISSLSSLRNSYLKGDISGILSDLDEYSNVEGIDKKVNEKFYKLILTDRNARMADTVIRKLKEQPDKTHFMVAGTLHYIGENSVVELLKTEGYKVTLQQ